MAASADVKSARTSLRDAAYTTLKQRIIGLDLKPGQRLVERDIAAQLGVSRVPLREALQLLESEGLVVLVPRQGALVAPFSRDDVQHLFEVRESVEVLATQLAALRATDEDLRAMRRIVQEARVAVVRGDDPAVAASNAAFHRAVVRASGNPLLQVVMAPLDARVQWLFHLTRHRDTSNQCEEHERLLGAIESGDVPTAAQLARDHVISGREPSLALASGWSADDFDPVALTRVRSRARRG